MLNTLPLISVIIPVYNGENYLAEAIESVLAQSYAAIELIVIDDGSQDASAKIAQSYPEVNYFYQDNQGLGAARNSGIRQAKGKYFAFLDHDDIWLPEKLALQYQALLVHGSEEVLVFSMLKQFCCPSLSDAELKKVLLPSELVAGICASALLVSRATFERVGFFIENFLVGEFIDWYGRAKFLNIQHLVLPEVLLQRRIHDSNIGRQKEKYSQQGFLKVLKSKLDRQRAANV